MTDEELEIFRQITAFSGKANDLHPLKLDRWWKTLVGAPDPIYLQMGFHGIFQQIDEGARAVQAMLDLVGPTNLPVSHQEIAQRHIGHFTFHVSSEETGARRFDVKWDKKKNHWDLSTPDAATVDATSSKFIVDLEKAVAKAEEWVVELDSAPATDA